MKDDLKDLLKLLKELNLEPARAQELLGSHMNPDLGFARVDAGRGNRSPMPEVILAEGKRTEEVVEESYSRLSVFPSLIP